MTTIVTLTSTPVTASTLVSRAMRLIGQISPGVSPTTDEYAACLEAMNAMLDSWRNEKLMCVATLDENFQLVAGQSSYTVGLAGDLNTNRPVRIDGAYVVSGGYSYDLTQFTAEQYADITAKATASDWPTHFYYAPDVPLGNIWVYPVPSEVSTMHVLTWTPQMAFTLISTTAYLAPGWEEAIATNLAIAIAPEFDTQASETVVMMAQKAKSQIKRINMTPLKLSSDVGALLSYRGRGNIITGTS